MRILSNALVLAITLCVGSNVVAQNCFLSADFEDGNFPSGWSNTSVTVIASGETTEAWRVGNADSANVNTYFPVPDQPIGNQFAMANDDALPCDCAMNAVYFTSPVMDLTARTNTAMECRVFHEMTLGGGPAVIETSVNGTDWSRIDSLHAVQGAWQNIFIDLSAFDGEAIFQLRFNWSDSGSWASGFAVDDICVFERVDVDVRVMDVRLHNTTSDPFNLDSADLRYTRLPLEQARPLVVSVIIENRGTTTVNDLTATADVQLAGIAQGTFNFIGPDTIAPGERDTLLIPTNWTANTVGDIDVVVNVPLGGADMNPTDNSLSTSMRVTGPGWDEGYGAMAIDDGNAQGRIGGGMNFIAANRMEIVHEGSVAHGASVVLDPSSQVGEQVRAILLSHNLTFIDTSSRHTITDADIELAWGGGSIYLPFSNSPALSTDDYFVGMQHLDGTGTVLIATSGNCSFGTSAIISGAILDVVWMDATPMVRLHLADYGVGVSETTPTNPSLIICPNPCDDVARVNWLGSSSGRARFQLFDEVGQLIRSWALPLAATVVIPTDDLPGGAYVLIAHTTRATQSARLFVAH